MTARSRPRAWRWPRSRGAEGSAYLIERGQYEELHEIIKRQGRQIDRIQARRPRARRH